MVPIWGPELHPGLKTKNLLLFIRFRSRMGRIFGAFKLYGQIRHNANASELSAKTVAPAMRKYSKCTRPRFDESMGLVLLGFIFHSADAHCLKWW